MPDLGPVELIMVLLVLTVLLAWILVVVRVIRLALDGGHAKRIQELESQVGELEKRR
ncbi:hypothetical protein GCM10010840_28550 [Deinococcus aerolatus]|uniref:Uncharacterized protein n=1 Tax=Deinococcus aerolatus TaxID=522487 RepID=A0ABQ2GDE5_9DEIO|nr:hypothetical protein [Deinococcus aerolatus]GGL88806.1 hypothetical protein GCM10010840_28550 [Deinococcus aerolatus]